MLPRRTLWKRVAIVAEQGRVTPVCDGVGNVPEIKEYDPISMTAGPSVDDEFQQLVVLRDARKRIARVVFDIERLERALNVRSVRGRGRGILQDPFKVAGEQQCQLKYPHTPYTGS